MSIFAILSPKFLVENIRIISLIIAGFFLVMFDNLVTEYAFRLADTIREGSARSVREFGKKTNFKKIETFGAKYFSEALATAIILLYCYFGTTVLADYIFTPILLKVQNIILIIVIAFFILISYVVNTKSVRQRLREV
jgi:hypothetical protein